MNMQFFRTWAKLNLMLSPLKIIEEAVSLEIR